MLNIFIVESRGLAVNLAIACALNAACAWLRWLGTAYLSGSAAFGVVLAGQALGAIAQPLTTNMATRVAADWFPANERDGANVFISMANPIGNALGSLVPGLVVAGPGDLPVLLLGQAVASMGVLAVALVAARRDRPLVPPSAAAASRWRSRAAAKGGYNDDGVAAASGTPSPPNELLLEQPLTDDKTPRVQSRQQDEGGSSSALQQSQPVVGVWATMRADVGALLRDRNFLLLASTFGIGLGIFNALLTLLAQIVGPCGYDATAAGIMGAALLGAGLIAAGIVGSIMQHTRAYARVLQVGVAAAVAGTILMLAALRPGAEALLIAAFAILGAALIPLLPAALENAVEATFPVPEDTSAGVLLLGGQLTGIIYTFSLGALIGVPPSNDCSSVVTPLAAFVAGNMLVAAGTAFAFRQAGRRGAAEAS